MADEPRGEGPAVEELLQRGVVGAIFGEELARRAVKAHDLGEHPEVPRVDRPAALSEEAAETLASGVLQAAATAAHGHAHLGGLRGDAQLGEEAKQRGIGPLVVHEEAGVDGERVAAVVEDVVGVSVAAEPGERLIEGHVMGGPEGVRGSESGHAGTDDCDLLHSTPPSEIRASDSDQLAEGVAEIVGGRLRAGLVEGSDR